MLADDASHSGISDPPGRAATMKIADYVASMISEDKSTSLDTQANLTPYEALQLLKDGD